MMNEQLWHKLFAEKITKEYIGKLTGEGRPIHCWTTSTSIYEYG